MVKSKDFDMTEWEYKRTPPFLPLNDIATLWSYLSLFN